MTPLALSRQECANHNHDGSCLGVKFSATGEIISCTPKARCFLSGDSRCLYFEECVAPMAGMVTEPRRAKEVEEAVFSYRMAHTGVLMPTTGRQKRRQTGKSDPTTPQEGTQNALQRVGCQETGQDSHPHQNGGLTVDKGAP